jgi:hypothetical protein
MQHTFFQNEMVEVWELYRIRIKLFPQSSIYASIGVAFILTNAVVLKKSLWI